MEHSVIGASQKSKTIFHAFILRLSQSDNVTPHAVVNWSGREWTSWLIWTLAEERKITPNCNPTDKIFSTHITQEVDKIKNCFLPPPDC